MIRIRDIFDPQVVQEVLLGRDGDGDLGRWFRGSGAHVAGQMGPVRFGLGRRLLFNTPRLGRSVPEGDPVHGRVRGALPVHRGVLCSDFLHRPENCAQIACHCHQPPT